MFTTFSADELDACGREFCDQFREHQKTIHQGIVVPWFAMRAPADRRVYCNPVDTHDGEFLFDLSITTWPSKQFHWPRRDYYRRACERGIRICLALECEFGEGDSDADSLLGLILDDATKLTVVRADAKVLVFSSSFRHAKHREDIIGLLTKMRVAAGDDAPWLLIDVPYEARSIGTSRRIHHRIIA